jgi:ABC-2 type transport system ATP-binding protein
MISQSIIKTENLTRTFNGLIAVDQLSFEVAEGEIFGFLGPNGAGKTTTVRMLTGQILPSSGCACVAGFDIVTQRKSLKPAVGVVFEHQNLYERLTARENLIFVAQLYDIAKPRVEEVLRLVHLTDRAGDRVQDFSNGMRQRLMIARALLHQPKVLFLDEPTKGLDPSIGRQIRTLIQELSEQGMTIFLTTHYMEEADQLCRRVAILNQGSITTLDTPERLKLRYGERQVKIALKNGEKIQLALDDQGDMQRLSELTRSDEILSLHTAEATLEEVFISLTGRRLLE